jgi:prepilin-type N-terminal cleavage/methylation domain-containing protein
MMKNFYRLPRRYTPRNDTPGFTLIELLVAMGIMAVLTGMAIFNFNQSRVRARDVQRKNDLKQLQSAMELYKNDNNSYPPEEDFLLSLQSPMAYIKGDFNDPRLDLWVSYYYQPAPNQKSYYLMACLENVTDSTKTTDTAVCDVFSDPAKYPVAGCTCGPTSTNKTGVVYIVTNP